MNSEFINDLLECSVCLKPLDEQNKVLPCQHTFCKLCLQTIVKSHKELRCPECRVLVKQKVEDLPANILLIRLLDGIKYQQNNKPQATEKPDFRRHSVEGILSSPVPASGGAKDGGLEANLVDLERRPIHERAISEPYSASSLQVSTATRPHAKALFDYESHIPSDLAFKKGDMVALTKRVDDNWFSGECHGRKGVFPANYVEVIQPLATDGPYCYALYDFESSDAEKDRDCLTFSKNEKIIVIRKVDENWVEGMLREKIGIFPLSFVKLSDDARKLFDTLSISDAGAKSPGSKGDADVREKGTMGAAARKIVSNKPGYKSSKKRHSFPTFHAAKASGENLPSSPYRHSMELSASVSGPPPSDSFHLHGKQDQVNLSNQDATSGRKSRNQIVTKADGIPSNVNNAVATAAVKMPMRVSSNVHIVQCRTSVERAKPNDRTPRGPTSQTVNKTVTASYSYHAQKPDELELVKGESYHITEMCNDGWCRGVNVKTGKSGVFPGNYISSNTKPPVSPSTTKKPADRSHSIPQQKGYEQYRQQAGPSKTPPPRPHAPKVVPTKSTTNEASRSHRASTPETTSSAQRDPRGQTVTPRGHSSTQRQQQLVKKPHKTESKKEKGGGNLLLKIMGGGGGKKVRTSSTPTTPVSPPTTANEDPFKSPNTQKKPVAKPPGRDRYYAVMSYPANSPDELDLTEGDVIMVHHRRPDGWFKGTHLGSGRTGHFPSTFVERVPHL